MLRNRPLVLADFNYDTPVHACHFSNSVVFLVTPQITLEGAEFHGDVRA